MFISEGDIIDYFTSLNEKLGTEPDEFGLLKNK